MTRLGAAAKKRAKTLKRESDNDNAKAPVIVMGHADLLDLGQKAAQEMLAKDEHDQRRRAHEGPPEVRTESWGIIAKKLFTGPKGDYWEGQVLGTLPGTDRPTIVHARTCQGLEAMAHRAYLTALTEGGVCNAAQARIRAADAEFYVSTVV